MERHRIGVEIAKIKARIDEIKSSRETYGIQSLGRNRGQGRGHGRGRGGGRGTSHATVRAERTLVEDTWPALPTRGGQRENQSFGQPSRSRRGGFTVGKGKGLQLYHNTYPNAQEILGELPPNSNPNLQLAIQPLGTATGDPFPPLTADAHRPLAATSNTDRIPKLSLPLPTLTHPHGGQVMEQGGATLPRYQMPRLITSRDRNHRSDTLESPDLPRPDREDDGHGALVSRVTLAITNREEASQDAEMHEEEEDEPYNDSTPLAQVQKEAKMKAVARRDTLVNSSCPFHWQSPAKIKNLQVAKKLKQASKTSPKLYSLLIFRDREMAEAVVSNVLPKLGKLVAEEAIFLFGVREKFEWLERELKWIKSFLRDADAKRKKDERVKNWVDEVIDVSYQAEDATDSFLILLKQPPIFPCFPDCIPR
ncbi:hypothetical protein J5N97_005205 [Dioscorea zingiberensis]|uniref:Disease resistance N-terminal domain-containing protein n=1 Tax=Dioscorea zingiberensis TaxID=325984 RepID=A0A9D5D8M0_9LILI|nr:hypothetical protein J5N97_005205 [Dioscorea zingiberensis]